MKVLYKKRIAIFLGHPAHFHLFKNVAENLKRKGYQIDFLVKKKDIVEQLVREAGYPYYLVRSKERTSSSKLALIWSVILMGWKTSFYMIRKRPQLLIGTHGRPKVCKLMGIDTITCNEDDANVVPLFAKITYPGTSVILVPTVCNCGKWNHKAIKYDSYQELAYLHPNNFIPDHKVVEKYFSTNIPYCIIRFAKLTAHHDNGKKGITTEIAQKIIDIVKPHLRIFITSERELEPQFEEYRMKIDPMDMHHVLAYASLYIGDSQTMAAEAGVLGTPFVRFNDFVGRIGYLKDLEDHYFLGYGVRTNEVDRLYEVITELVNMPNRDTIFKERKENMLSDKIDYASFLTWFIEEYPSSSQIMRDDPQYQIRFK
jgi:hypothetical protein